MSVQITNSEILDRRMSIAASKLAAIADPFVAKVGRGESVMLADLLSLPDRLTEAADAFSKLASSIRRHGAWYIENGPAKGNLLIATRYSHFDLLIEGPRFDRKNHQFTETQEDEIGKSVRKVIENMESVATHLIYLQVKIMTYNDVDLVVRLTEASASLRELAMNIKSAELGNSTRT